LIDSRDSIGRATKLPIPAILLLPVGLSASAVTLSGVADGYVYYLSPDLGTLRANLGTIVLLAVGQAFFTPLVRLQRDDCLLFVSRR
jgi:NSS family neurotransmitter:Na+ symporter